VLLAALIACFLGAGSRIASAGDIPDWLKDAVQRPTAGWAGSAPLLTLDDEEHISFPHDGRVRIEVRGASRILSPAGVPYAACSAYYNRGRGDVRDFRAWWIPPAGAPQLFDRGDASDRSAAGDYTLYSEVRELTVAPPNPTVGGVFAWDYVTEEDALLGEWRWFFGGRFPSLRSQFSITLPKDLEPVEHAFAADGMQRSHDDQTWSWVMHDLRARPTEFLASAQWSVDPCVVVTAKGRDSARRVGISFESWDQVSSWLYRLSDPQAARTSEIDARATTLTAGARDTIERLRALGRDVQGTNYVSIEMGLTRGGGYQPHPAVDVLKLGYGDCKDKANLLRSLVGAAGGRAWLIGVNADARDRVEQQLPSPDQFNHCIVALQVPRGTRMPAVFEHPVLGTLMAFDPTDNLTPLGQLPAEEEGSLGVLEADAGGGLVRLPVAPPELHGVIRHIQAQLGPQGELTAAFEEHATGAAATFERRLRREYSEAGYRKLLESWIAGSGAPAAASEVQCVEDSAAGTFALKALFSSPLFARVVGGRLLSFSPHLIHERGDLALPDTLRLRPIALQAFSFAETVMVRMPEGFEVDEIPAAIHDHQDFGSLDAEWIKDGQFIRFTRTLRHASVTLPAARYGDVRSLLAADLAASRAAVVLIRR
jgi:transglutaminase-like putative cysteine protease